MFFILLNNKWPNDLTSLENDILVSIENSSVNFRQENIYKPKMKIFEK